MRALVWRYVTAMHRRYEENPVTEDDINEVKGDISSFRYELLEVLQKNGMDVSSAEMKEKGKCCSIQTFITSQPLRSCAWKKNEGVGKAIDERF